MLRPFRQVDVFTDQPYRGNPVAVVHDAAGIDDAAFLRFAQWTNLSETTFLLPPTSDEADYRVRIFTPVSELPFAGHPTLGTCHAWLEGGGLARDPALIVQECVAGLIPIRRSATGLAFAAPPLVRDGPVDEATVAHIADVLRIPRAAIVDAQWADNGPGWVAVLLSSAAEVLALRPDFVDLDLGVAGPYPAGESTAFEVRAFFPVNGATVEDPVTGSLNASLAVWLLRTGRATAPYVASQGTALGRAGQAHTSARIRTARSGSRAGRSLASAARSRSEARYLTAPVRSRRHHLAVPKPASPPAPSTTWPQVLTLRLQRQCLDKRATSGDLVDVVARMIGLHAQVMSSAELQAAARLDRQAARTLTRGVG